MSGIEDAMATQFARCQGLFEFKCYHCKHWKGGCGCERNCFITAVGCNTVMCSLFEEETCERCRERKQRGGR